MSHFCTFLSNGVSVSPSVVIADAPRRPRPRWERWTLRPYVSQVADLGDVA